MVLSTNHREILLWFLPTKFKISIVHYSPTLISYDFYYLCDSLRELKRINIRNTISRKSESGKATGEENKTYRVEVDPSKPKYYVLDMFPYPSGAGVARGTPARLHRFRHLFPLQTSERDSMSCIPWDMTRMVCPRSNMPSKTGQHPAITTEKNIRRYREQMDKIGFSFDWDREIRTCDPEYYKWTQWTFIQMFNSFYCLRRAKSHADYRTGKSIRGRRNPSD